MGTFISIYHQELLCTFLRYILYTMSRKTVLYCITKSVWGGAQRYVYDLAVHLPPEHYNIIVASGGVGPLFGKLTEKGIRTVCIPSLARDVRLLDELRVFFHLILLLVKEKPDIIHLNSSKIGVVGALAGRVASLLIRKKIKIIFTIHGWVFNEDRPLIQKKLLYIATRIGAFFQDTIITINSRDFETGKKIILQKKLAFIFNGIPETIYYSREEARRQLSSHTGQHIADDTLLLGSIAELTKNKGLSYLISALATIKLAPHSFHTVIIGGGEDEIKLKKEIRDYRIEHKVTLAGFFPDASAYLKGFDVFILSSVKEGLPYVILEAMSAGVPIVATDIGGVPDLITHKRTGLLVPAKNSGHIASAIKRFAGDPKLRSRLAANARERQRTTFNLNAMLKETYRLYV